MPHLDSLFSVTFRGFSREEVAAYIAEMNRSFKESGAKYEAQIASLKEELESLKAAKEQCGEIQKEVAERDETIGKLNEELERLKNDRENANLAASAAEERAATASKTVEGLKTELEAERIKSAAHGSQNAKEYDSMLADVNRNSVDGTPGGARADNRSRKTCRTDRFRCGSDGESACG